MAIVPNDSSFILPIYTSSSLYFLIIASSIDNQFTSALSFNKWLNHSDQIQDYMHLDALHSTLQRDNVLFAKCFIAKILFAASTFFPWFALVGSVSTCWQCPCQDLNFVKSDI